jgi:hypothetical protein
MSDDGWTLDSPMYGLRHTAGSSDTRASAIGDVAMGDGLVSTVVEMVEMVLPSSS